MSISLNYKTNRINLITINKDIKIISDIINYFKNLVKIKKEYKRYLNYFIKIYKNLLNYLQSIIFILLSTIIVIFIFNNKSKAYTYKHSILKGIVYKIHLFLFLLNIYKKRR